MLEITTELTSYHLMIDTETAIFQKNWIHRISTSLQFGTARMIHNIPLGNRAKTRISKEEYGGRIQAIENGENSDSEDETDEEGDTILMEKEQNTKKQDEQPIVREIFLGGDSYIHTQQGEGEVESFDTHASQFGMRNNNTLGNQHIVAMNLDENLNCSGNTVRIECG